MIKTTGCKAVLALVLMAGWSAVFAATVSLVPSVTTIGTNDEFTVNLDLDARDINNQPYSGEVLISYDPLLITYISFAESISGITGAPVIDTSGSLHTVWLGFGTVGFDVGTIGTYTFMSNATTGIAGIGLADGNGLTSFLANGDAESPSFYGTSITVVPLPGTIWLMLSGLGLLGFARRKA